MAIVIARLSAADIHSGFSEIAESRPEDVLNPKFDRFNLDSLTQTVVQALAQYSHFYNLDDQRHLLEFLDRVHSNIYGPDHKRLRTRYGNYTILTRPVLLYLLNQTLFGGRLGGSAAVTNIGQISHFIEKLNCFDDDVQDPDVLASVNDPDSLLDVLTALFRHNYLSSKGRLSLAELLRNYDLVERILQSHHGERAAEVFIREYEIDILSYLEIGYLLYVYLYSRRTKGDFSNVIDWTEWSQSDFPDWVIQNVQTFISKQACVRSEYRRKPEDLYDFYMLWKYPIVRHGRYAQVMDTSLLVEKMHTCPFLFFESPYLEMERGRGTSNNNMLRSETLGDSYEEQCTDVVRSLGHEPLRSRFPDGTEISDIVIEENRQALLLEAKAGYLPVKQISRGIDRVTVESYLTKIGYEYPSDGDLRRIPSNQRKGITQLIASFAKLVDANDWRTSAHIVWEDEEIEWIGGAVVVQDFGFSVSCLNRIIYLKNADVMSVLSSNQIKVGMPVVVHVSDLSKIRAGGISLVAAVREYSESVRGGSVKTFRDFLDKRYQWPAEITKEEYDSFFIEKIQKKYFPNSVT